SNLLRMSAYMAMINATLLPISPFNKGGLKGDFVLSSYGVYRLKGAESLLDFKKILSSTYGMLDQPCFSQE
ncbi:MAG: hypothetical protein ACE5KJ_06275, partial [Candidatus Zixiibacteriota bacterium]